MNPISIRNFDVNNSSRTVTNLLYDLCLTEGVDGAKAPKDGLQWESCVSFKCWQYRCQCRKMQFDSLAVDLENVWSIHLWITSCLVHISASHANDVLFIFFFYFSLFMFLIIHIYNDIKINLTKWKLI